MRAERLVGSLGFVPTGRNWRILQLSTSGASSRAKEKEDRNSQKSNVEIPGDPVDLRVHCLLQLEGCRPQPVRLDPHWTNTFPIAVAPGSLGGLRYKLLKNSILRRVLDKRDNVDSARPIARDRFQTAQSVLFWSRLMCKSCGGTLQLKKSFMLSSFTSESWPSRHARAGFRCLRPIHNVATRVEPLSVFCERWLVDQVFHKGRGSIFHPFWREDLNKSFLQVLPCQAKCQHRCRIQTRMLPRRLAAHAVGERIAEWQGSCVWQSHTRRLSLKRSRFSTTSVCSAAQRIPCEPG